MTVGVATALGAAETALSAALGAGVRLAEPMLLKSWERNDVWRCRVVGQPAGLPASVVVKHFKADRARGLDDWASLDFLTRLGLERPLAPRFLAGDLTAAVFVTEDLGAGRTLDDLLMGHDGPASAQTLIALARLTGRLHAATLSRHVEYDRLRDGLGARPATTKAAAAAFLRARCRDVGAWFSAVGVTPPAGWEQGLEAVARVVEAPGPFTAFTHGDIAPTNNHLGARGLRLLDFEYGGVRHALYDTLFWTLFCPFPPVLITAADEAYRGELATACEAARDDAVYGEARVAVTAWRTLNMLQWFSPAILETDQPWAPGLTLRQALLWQLDRFLGVAAAAGAAVAPLVTALRCLATALGRRWGAEREAMVVWPAFRRGA